MKEQLLKPKELVYIFVSLFLSWIITRQIAHKMDLMGDINLYLFFLIVFFLFGIMFVAVDSKFEWIRMINYKISKQGLYVGGVAVFCFTCLLVYISNLNSKSLLGRGSEPISLVENSFNLFCFLILFFLFALLIYFNKQNRYSWLDEMYWGLACLLICFTFFCYYTPIMSAVVSNEDFDAYWKSVYLYLNRIPVTETNTSFYGHYGLLLVPIFKVVGFSVRRVMFVTVSMMAFVVSILVIAIYRIIDNGIIRILALGALSQYILYAVMVYPQGYPHRILFPALFIFFTTFVREKNIIKNVYLLLVGYFFATMGLIWSNDLGIICLAAWLLFSIIYMLLYLRKNILLAVGLNIVMAGITFLFAWGIVDFFNIFVYKGKPVSLRLFLHPLLERNGVSGFSEKLSWAFQPWTIVVFIGLISLSVSMIGLLRNINADKCVVLVLTSIMMIGRIVYYINRPAWGNLRLASQQELIVLIAVLLDIFTCDILDIKDDYKRVLCDFCISIPLSILLVGMFYFSILYMPNLILKEYNNYAMMFMEYNADYSEPKNNLGADYLFVGQGALYYSDMLDLDANYLTIESWTNTFHFDKTIEEIINSKKQIVIPVQEKEYFMEQLGIERLNKYYQEPYYVEVYNNWLAVFTTK